ncbi:hypothetical protein Ahy_B09g098218 [Arachis hypogaea]|uniref:Protein FAR1-RELATED SEQUENCE n=1 Tax=Arachis hypogaea TaxID=3818 RepID=A0A444XQU3_ARAHY|nr:hypothetical protein Ahy_B09g098218 [Arachis hypogaea]
MLKQHMELSMFVRRTIETHEEARIRPSKTYQSFVAVASNHRELDFIEKDVRNYITRKVWNIFEEDDAKEIGKYLHLTETGSISLESTALEATSGFQIIKISIRIIFMLISFFPKACTIFSSPDLIVSVWFAELYEDRHIWIPVYLDHHFWAGMRSTQRSEIIRQLPSKQRASRLRIQCCRFSHRDTVCNKISNRGTVSACIYP